MTAKTASRRVRCSHRLDFQLLWIRAFSFLVAGAISLVATLGPAATYTWDSDANGANGDTDGPGIWSTLNSNWYLSGTDVGWTNGASDIALFGGGSGGPGTYAISILSNVTAVGGIQFAAGDSSNFTFSSNPSINLGTGGITVGSGAGAETFGSGALFILAGSQSWTNNSSNTLALSGTVAGSSTGVATLTLQGSGNTSIGGLVDGSGGALSLLVAGTGTVKLTANSSAYSGITTISSGTLQLGAGNAIPSTSLLTVQGTGSFDANGLNDTVRGLSDGSVSTGIVGNSSTAAGSTLTLAVPAATTDTFSGTIKDAIGAGTKTVTIRINNNATGVQVLTGSNTYSGGTNINAGTLSFASGALGSAGAITFTGSSTLQWNGTNTQDVSSRLAINNGITGTLDTQGNSVTLASAFGGAGTGKLTKAGSGVLTIAAADTYTGGSTVSAGTLLLTNTGSLAAGSVSIANSAVLAGTGTIGGTVTPASGGIISPGVPGTNNGLGTLNVASLVLNSGSILNLEIDNSGNSDQINITSSGGATFNGGNIFLYQPGTANPFVPGNGTYTIGTINGGISGSLSNLTIADPQAGKFYSLSSTATSIQLTIGNATTSEWNNSGGTGLWTTSGNWTAGVPNAVGVTAKFGTLAAGGSVDLNGSKTLSGLIFDSSSPYTLNASSGTLTLNNGASVAAISVNNGSHTIAAPVSMTRGAFVSFNNSSTNLTISGGISGTGPLSIGGTGGTLTLAGTNTYTGATTVYGGLLKVTGSLASGSAVTINSGGTLGGSGTVGGTVAVNSGGAISPGNSPGTISTGATTYNGGGSYLWEINKANGTQGADPGWDLQTITGGLTISAASGNPFNIAL
jgi:fibronectin-binding autotransporter adhesin